MKMLPAFVFGGLGVVPADGGSVLQILYVKPTARGVRVWLECNRLSDHGFIRGARFSREVKNGVITYKLDKNGSLRVSGRNRNGKDLPIIDFSAVKIDGLEVNDQLVAKYDNGVITIKKG